MALWKLGGNADCIIGQQNNVLPRCFVLATAVPDWAVAEAESHPSCSPHTLGFTVFLSILPLSVR